ncbi:hypothetical protein F5Y01DRAFT_316181 [Xylaria sp. FL0043]|nr:hypothetical protein F5Y01DRAFT_316181 [Xylaria sp. FL0043]
MEARSYNNRRDIHEVDFMDYVIIGLVFASLLVLLIVSRLIWGCWRRSKCQRKDDVELGEQKPGHGSSEAVHPAPISRPTPTNHPAPINHPTPISKAQATSRNDINRNPTRNASRDFEEIPLGRPSTENIHTARAIPIGQVLRGKAPRQVEASTPKKAKQASVEDAPTEE